MEPVFIKCTYVGVYVCILVDRNYLACDSEHHRT
jgi:hypothetical protein